MIFCPTLQQRQMYNPSFSHLLHPLVDSRQTLWREWILHTSGCAREALDDDQILVKPLAFP